MLLTLADVLICSGTLQRRQVTVESDRQLLCHLFLAGSGIQGLSVYVKMNTSFVCSETKCKKTVAPFPSTVQNSLWHHPDTKYINEDEQSRTGLWWHSFNSKLLSMLNKKYEVTVAHVAPSGKKNGLGFNGENTFYYVKTD